MALTFSYGDYTLDPKPLFNINKEYIKTPANTGLGTRYVISLQGNLLPFVADGLDQGITGVFDGVKRLREAFDTDYKILYLGCAGEDPIISGHPKITSLNVDQGGGDNYVQRATYSIELNLPTLVGTGFETVGPETDDFSSRGIISYSDEFSLEFANERAGGQIVLTEGNTIDFPSVYTVNHNVSAQGEPLLGFNPTNLAQNFVASRLGWNNIMSGVSGIINASGVVCNNFRTISVNQTEGTCNASETFVINPSGSYQEDFELSVNTSYEEPYTTVDVNGTIQGYATLVYPDATGRVIEIGPPPITGTYDFELQNSITGTIPKFQNAIAAWSGTVDTDGTTPLTVGISGLLYTRANSFYQINPKHPAFLASNSLNLQTLNTAVGYNITEGTISYAYSYNDRPINCVPEALSEVINITENEPADIFASLTILGRDGQRSDPVTNHYNPLPNQGPLLQDINASGPRTRDISIDAFLPIGTGTQYTRSYEPAFGSKGNLLQYQLNVPSFFSAPTGYDALVSGYELELRIKYANVFITSENKTWQPKLGRFTYNKSWTVGDC